MTRSTVVITFVDVSERRHVEEALRTAAPEFYLLLCTAPALVVAKVTPSRGNGWPLK